MAYRVGFHLLRTRRIMTAIRMALSRLTTKRVPLLSLFLVAVLGAVGGVLAASISITSNSFNGESGTYHSNAGTLTIVDNGLAVVANTPTGGNQNNFTGTVVFGANASSTARDTILTAGHWMDVVVLTSNLKDNPTNHVVTLTFRSGTGAIGATLATATATVQSFSAATASTGTITVYIDLGASPLTSPVTLYATIT